MTFLFGLKHPELASAKVRRPLIMGALFKLFEKSL